MTIGRHKSAYNTQEHNSVYILGIDAKDIYEANHYIYPSEKGYEIRDAEGNISYRRFLNTLDYSLELMKLREVYEATFRKKQGFSFWAEDKEYSSVVVNVSFEYTYKPWNQVTRRNKDGVQITYYVKAGYRFSECEFRDCLAFLNGELIGVATNTPVGVPVSDAVLKKFFFFDQNLHVYKINKSRNQPIKNRKELREELYTNGFILDGYKYVRFKRSSGSSRVGKCLFIREEMYQRMWTWEKCGIKIYTDHEVDLAAWEAYIALTLSSLVGTLELKPENILLIKDYESTFEDKMMAIGFEDGKLTADATTTEISNCIWDGQSLLDKSMFAGGYEDRGMLLLRTRFFKSACFNTNIQRFFQDNGITDVSQLKGKTRAKRLEDIKLITTPSSVKYLKFGSWNKWLDNLEPTFGIVKFEKPTHFFDGDLVQAHYQLLNTLHMSREDVREFLQETKDYFYEMDNNPAAFRHYVGCRASEEGFNLEFAATNSVIYYLLGHNKFFEQTKMYHDWKKNILNSFRDNVREGHVLVKGTYATLFGNPYEMLAATIGKFDGTSLLGQGNVWCRMFADGEEILGSRSPHVAAGNVLLTRNKHHEYLDRYFNLTPEIVCINSIEENILERLSGADFDSDTMLVTSNPLLIRKAKEHYQDFLVPTKLIPAATKHRPYNSQGKAELDHVTADNKIGEIVNLSQELNTWMWHRLNTEGIFDNEIYENIAKLDVLSNIEIDRAKREYAVKAGDEMAVLREKYLRRDGDGKRIRPAFFGQVFPKYRDTNKCNYMPHETTMDYLQEETKWALNTKRGHALRPLTTIFDLGFYRESKAYPEQINALAQILRQAQKRIKSLWIKYAKEEDKNCKAVLIDRINAAVETRRKRAEALDITQSSLQWLMLHLEDKCFKDIRHSFLRLFFANPTERFQRFLKSTETGTTYLQRTPFGDILIYGIPHEEIDESV